jgi:hypothetical protein
MGLFIHGQNLAQQRIPGKGISPIAGCGGVIAASRLT